MFTGGWPWQWTPEQVERWLAEGGWAYSTVRSYQGALAMFVWTAPGFVEAEFPRAFPGCGSWYSVLLRSSVAANTADAQGRSRWSPRSAVGARRNDLDGTEHRRRLGGGGTLIAYAASVRAAVW